MEYRLRRFWKEGIVLSCLLCLLGGCGASGSAASPSASSTAPFPTTAVETPDGNESIPEASSLPEAAAPAVPAATGFRTLTRANNSILGCGSESGYYEARTRENDTANYPATNLFYIDYATAQEIYLCADPNCTHDHAGCNAWVSGEEGGLFPLSTGDNLLLVHIAYGYESGARAIPCIVTANLDGSNRQTLIRFSANERLKDVFAVSEAKLVCALDAVSKQGIEDDYSNAVFKLVMVDLNTGERTDFYERSLASGTEPVFMGVTENGYCVLRDLFIGKSEDDFPNQEWADIRDEIERSYQYTCTVIPVGSSQPAGTFLYSGRIYDLLADDGLYYLDRDTRILNRVSVPDGTVTALTTLPDDNAESGYLDGKMDDWFLLSQRYYEEQAGVSYPVAMDCCYAVNTQTGEVKSLSIRQDVAQDRRMCTMLAQNGTDVLLITDSENFSGNAFGFEYSLISKDAYLTSDTSALRKIQFLQ